MECSDSALGSAGLVNYENPTFPITVGDPDIYREVIHPFLDNGQAIKI